MPGIPLSQLRSTEALATVYDANPLNRSTIVIVVEGDDDKAIMERWFAGEIKSRAVALSTPKSYAGSADGCAAVIRVVTAVQGQAVAIYGIVDRDYLVENYRSVFLQSDDVIFVASTPHLPRVRVLRRWEIESYLVDVVTLHQLLADNRGDVEASSLGAARVDAIVADVVDAVLVLTATNIALRDAGERSYPPNWNVPSTLNRQDMERLLDGDLFPGKIPMAKRAEFIFERQAVELALRGFGAGYGPRTSDYVNGLLRVVDGKAVLSRVLKSLKISLSETMAKRMLASLMVRSISSQEGIPTEFVEHVEHFKRAGLGLS